MGDDESDSVQLSGHETRILTDLERIKLSEDKTLVSPFKQDKLEREAQRNWDLFYKRNSTKFFKDRHWTTREFQELCGKKVIITIILHAVFIDCLIDLKPKGAFSVSKVMQH